MLKVGLTGGIASGKSTVAEMFRDEGAYILDSDQVTHELLAPGQEVHDAVIREFGPGVLGADGSIDRRALGAIVFADPDRRQVLNRLVHPAISERQETFLDEVRRRDPRAVAIVDAALMIETGSYTRYDRVIVVRCDTVDQRRRLTARGRLSESEADARIRAQMPVTEKVKYADHVIDNSGSVEDTRRQVRELWMELKAAAVGDPAQGDRR